MIPIKNYEQLKLMRTACRITGEALLVAEEAIRPGISTKALDEIIRAYIEKCGAKPTFLGYGGFPGAACISINQEVIHGIPSKDRILCEGDIVKIDVGAFCRGFTGDAARTYPVGKISAEAERLTGRRREEAGRMAAHLFLMARTAETTVNVKRFSMLRHAAMEMTGTLPTHHHLMEPVTAMPIYLTNDPEWPEACRILFDAAPPTPAELLALAARVVEEECDKLYLASMRALTQNTTDVLRTISWRKIYESLEACSDACEHVSECVGSVIMKNT